jgi:hypothetical protein
MEKQDRQDFQFKTNFVDRYPQTVGERRPRTFPTKRKLPRRGSDL